MTRRNWKLARPASLVEALRLCVEFAKDRHNLSVERVADRMGASHDSLYKWVASGRLPANLLLAFETACGCHFASTWQAMAAGKLVIDMPTGSKASPAELVAVNSCFASALQLLTDFYAAPAKADASLVQAALNAHLAQVAWHHANVGHSGTPEFDFFTPQPDTKEAACPIQH